MNDRMYIIYRLLHSPRKLAMLGDLYDAKDSASGGIKQTTLTRSRSANTSIGRRRILGDLESYGLVHHTEQHSGNCWFITDEGAAVFEAANESVFINTGHYISSHYVPSNDIEVL